MARLIRDENRIPVIGAVSSTDSVTLVQLEADATTKGLNVQIVGDDVGIGGGTSYTEDVATANPIVGTATVIERDDQLSTVTPVAGDWIGLRGSSEGALWVAIADAAGDPITSFGGGTEYTEDVATANPQVGSAIMVERDDALSAVIPAEADWIGLRGSAEGALWTQDFNSDAILADTAAIVTDLAAIEALAITIDADTNVIQGAVAAGQMQVDIVADGAGLATSAGQLADGHNVTIDNISTNEVYIRGGGTAGSATDGEVVAVQGIASGTAMAVTESSPISGFATSAAQLVDGHNVTIDNAAAGAAVNIQDGGNAITVDATNLDIRDLTNVSDSVLIYGSDDAGTTKRVIKTDAGGAIQIDLEVAEAAVTNAGTFVVQEDGAALTALQLIDDVVYVDDTAVHATGTSKGVGIMAAATPTDGSVAANDIGMVAMSTDRRMHVDAQIVGTDAALDVSGATVTVSGTVTANLSATDNAVLDTIDAALDTIKIDTEAIETAVELLDNAVDGNYLNTNMNIAGTDVSANAGVLTAQTQRVTIATDDEVNNLLGTIDADTGAMVTDLAAIEALLITIDSDTNAIKTAVEIMDDWDDTNYANVNLNIAGTDVSANAGVLTAQTQRVTIATDDEVNNLLGTIDADTSSMAADLGTMDTDTGNIATYTAGAETALEAMDGAIIGPGEPTIDSYTHLAINLGVVTDSVLVASAASKQIWVYGITYTCSVAGTVSFQDEDNTAITGVMDHAANSGLSHSPSGNFAMPIWKLATNKDLEVDTVTCSIDGWLDYAIVSV